MNLKKMALVFIYPDGEIEPIPITNHLWHTIYMKEHLVTSPKFAHICDGLKISDGPHYDVDVALAKHSVISLFNGNIYDILNDPEWLANNIVNFIVYLPENISLEQANSLESILKGYPEEGLIIGQFSRKENDYKEISIDVMNKTLCDIKDTKCR